MKYLILIFSFLHFQFAIAKDLNTTIKVQGLVCAFCAQGVTKNMNAKREVASTDVDLDKMEVHITFHEGKTLNETALQEVIEGAGFKYMGLKNEKN